MKASDRILESVRKISNNRTQNINDPFLKITDIELKEILETELYKPDKNKMKPFSNEIIVDIVSNYTNERLATAVIVKTDNDVDVYNIGVSIRSISENTDDRAKALRVARGRVLVSSNTYSDDKAVYGMPVDKEPHTMGFFHSTILENLKRLVHNELPINNKRYYRISIG